MGCEGWDFGVLEGGEEPFAFRETTGWAAEVDGVAADED